MFEIGRLCVKTAGRDAGRKCVIIDSKDGKLQIDGETRRRLCNPAHLEPLADKLDVKKGASRADVIAAFKKIKIELRDTKPKKAAARPTQVRKVKEKPVKAKKAETGAKTVDVKATPAPKSEAKPAPKAEPKVAESKPVEKKPAPKADK